MPVKGLFGVLCATHLWLYFCFIFTTIFFTYHLRKHKSENRFSAREKWVGLDFVHSGIDNTYKSSQTGVAVDCGEEYFGIIYLLVSSCWEI